MLSKSLLERRHEKRPKFSIQANITGAALPDGIVNVSVEINGESDKLRAANILQMAADVLRKGGD